MSVFSDKYAYMLSQVSDVLTTVIPATKRPATRKWDVQKNRAPKKAALPAPFDEVTSVMSVFGKHYAVGQGGTVLFEVTENGAETIRLALEDEDARLRMKLILTEGPQNSAWAPSPFLLGDETVR